MSSPVPSSSDRKPMPRELTAEALQWLEDEITCLFFSVYSVGEGGRHWAKQQSAVLSLAPESEVRDRLKEMKVQMGEELGKELHIDIYDETTVIRGEEKRTTPTDHIILALDSDFVLARRSPATGKIYYSDDFEYCPQTSKALKPVITAKGRE